MNKRVLFVVVAVIVLTMVIGAFPALAHDKKVGDCSPGFWKNHFEIYSERADANELYEMLWSRGGGENKEARFEAASILNHAYPFAPCDD